MSFRIRDKTITNNSQVQAVVQQSLKDTFGTFVQKPAFVCSVQPQSISNTSTVNLLLSEPSINLGNSFAVDTSTSVKCLSKNIYNIKYNFVLDNTSYASSIEVSVYVNDNCIAKCDNNISSHTTQSTCGWVVTQLENNDVITIKCDYTSQSSNAQLVYGQLCID